MDLQFVTNMYIMETGEYESGISAYKQYKFFFQKKPTAIFAMNDLMAMGFINAALQDGMNLPDELSIIGFDNRESSRYFRPGLTTIDLPLEQMGYESGRALFRSNQI